MQRTKRLLFFGGIYALSKTFDRRNNTTTKSRRKMYLLHMPQLLLDPYIAVGDGGMHVTYRSYFKFSSCYIYFTNWKQQDSQFDECISHVFFITGPIKGTLERSLVVTVSYIPSVALYGVFVTRDRRPTVHENYFTSLTQTK